MASSASASTLAVLLLFSLCLAFAHGTSIAVDHLMGGSDREIADRKVRCYQDIDNGLWGDACKASEIDKENCALACISSTCYNSVYGGDPLEEGEIDLRRGRQFKACIQGLPTLKVRLEVGLNHTQVSQGHPWEEAIEE
ncbi:uncharacterized protein [Physcomitrium patens]|uniref:Uncharacterized protein n=2 Tax=Physcomitrium patens TaxID=3218 RepID=A0A7I4BIM1_PHYPA|nr:uncharacterized protein LOC112295095 isoform X2 [Physcomitrium patens]|eukprot:XP_024402039.1 uncharacterized protein LOC112295095 isoform X2 [Physcomitrella patens]